MTLQIYASHYRHPEGKQYFLAMIRDSTGVGGTWVVKNWGKAVDQGFSMGQIQAEHFDDHDDAVAANNREEGLRYRRGYVQQLVAQWDTFGEIAQRNLEVRASIDLSNLGSSSPSATRGWTTLHDQFGNPIDPNGNLATPLAEQKPKKEIDPDAIPGPRTGGSKRLEWVMAHSEHPQALDQMMQVAAQMSTERDKAATTVAAIDNDLAFVNAWLSQTLANVIRNQ